MSVRNGKRNTKAPEVQHGPKGANRSKYLRRLDKRTTARVAGYEAVPTAKRGGFIKPGSQQP